MNCKEIPFRMLTIFSVPKASVGPIALIQRNAVASWAALRPWAEVVLIGDEDGAAELAADLDVLHIPAVDRTSFGTPTVRSAFALAQDVARGSTMMYVNCDIVLTRDVIDVVESIPFPAFLASCRRWDLDVKDAIDFSDANWEACLRTRVRAEGSLHLPTGMDCFIFPRDMFTALPPFAIGRAGWDSWLVYAARSRRLPVIDATGAMTIIHQNHDYSHHRLGKVGVHRGPEAERNLDLGGGWEHVFTLDNADWIMDGNGLRKAPLLGRSILSRLRSVPALHPAAAPFVRPLFRLGRALFRTE